LSNCDINGHARDHNEKGKADLGDEEDQESVDIFSCCGGIVDRLIFRVRVSYTNGF
jgi:hypothetical protein